MVLAAGRGTRLRPVTDTIPKPLLPVGEKTLLEYQFDRLQQLGISDVVINLHHLGGQIESFVRDLALPMNINFSQEEQALETGGGIRRALPMLGDEPFLVVSADTYLEGSIEAVLEPLPDGVLGRLLMTDNPVHHRAGDFAIGNDGVLEAEGERLTYTGTSLLSPDLVCEETMDVFPLRQVFDRAISGGRLLGHYHAGFWWDVGTVERLAQLRQRLAR